MSTLLQIFRAKPNPGGKDKTGSGIPKPEQLLGEWVDLKNVGTEPVKFGSVQLQHTLFNDNCQTSGRTEPYWTDSGSDALQPGQVLRVYTGRKRDEHLMAPVDREGRDWSAFANRDYFVLNNKCGDAITVTWANVQGNQFLDTATYRPNQPEGAVLRRSGNSLVP